MTERLLQFIWQFQYFNKNTFSTVNGEAVQVITPGVYNYNQGPDFSNARIIIDNTTWAGTVELHIKTSDWNKHKHQDDKNYGNVILHVVWEDDSWNGSTLSRSIPLVELKSRVPKILLQRYETLMHSQTFIPCDKNIHQARDITWKSWKERLLAERLLRKAAVVKTYLQQSNFHWEETFWWILAKNFGMKVNGEAFESIARSLPLTIVNKHKNQVHQLEALLLGQAGLLEQEFKEHYPKQLQKEYKFLQKKLHLQPIRWPLHLLRMRPVNFPAIRLAELATLVHQSAHLFSKIKEAASAKEIRQLFEIAATDYWNCHYQLDTPSAFKIKKAGTSMRDNIVINTVAPVLFAYGDYHREDAYKDKAVQCLEEIAGEKNQVVNGFNLLGIESKSARDSQALIELKTEYCNHKRCLECSVGNAFLRQA